MWFAICLTISMGPSGGPRVDLKAGHGRYGKKPHAHVRLDTRELPFSLVPLSSTDPRQPLTPMAQFLRCL